MLGPSPAIEVMQMGPQTAALVLPRGPTADVTAHDGWAELLSGEALAAANMLPGAWTTRVYSASMHGVGVDNPADPQRLTALQAARSVMAMLEQVESFQVRLDRGRLSSHRLQLAQTTSRTSTFLAHPCSRRHAASLRPRLPPGTT